MELVKAEKAIVTCPEQLGSLKTPRQSAECIKIHGGVIVMTKDGEDVTAEFLKGAKETLNIAKLYNCKYGILKKNNPYCGLHTHDGSFTGTLSDIRGLTADMLLKNGIEVISSED